MKNPDAAGPDDLVLPMTCPFCGKLTNRHQAAGEPAVPEAGDVAVCWGCGNVFVFDDPPTAVALTAGGPGEAHLGILARRPTAEEQAVIDNIPTEAVALTRGILVDGDTEGGQQ